MSEKGTQFRVQWKQPMYLIVRFSEDSARKIITLDNYENKDILNKANYPSIKERIHLLNKT